MKNAHHIGEIVSRLMETYRRRPESELTRIWELWNGIVGEVVATHAKPEAFKGKILLVTVSSSTWIHHLQFLKKEIIAKVNEVFGTVVLEDIKFKIGTI